MRARHVMGVAITLGALAGCSSPAASPAPAPGQVTVNQPAETAPALPECAEVFVPGKPVDGALALAGCTNPAGTVQAIGGHDCQNGGKLWQVDANSGAPAGYGFEGKKYVAVKGETAADRGYKRAYDACMSDKPAAQPTSVKPADRVKVPETGKAVEVAVGSAPSATTVRTASEPTTPPEQEPEREREPEPSATPQEPVIGGGVPRTAQPSSAADPE